jgi:DNA-binding MarR family transcriptional regulator
MDARSLAAEAGVTAATLTGVMKTLEGRGLLRRKGDRADGRRILVSLTARGRTVVGDVMPAFNRHESLVTQALTESEQDDMARFLRTILRTIEAIDL